MNTDFRVKNDFFTHHKTKILKRKLGSDAVLCLLTLWAYASKHRPDGNLRGMTEEFIEASADWEGEAGAFVAAILDLGFLEEGGEGFLLHDWEEHNPWAADAKTRSEKAKNAASKRWNKSINAQSMPDGCSSNAQALHEHETSNAKSMHDDVSSNAPSPSPSPSPSPTPTYNPPLNSPHDGGNEEQEKPKPKKRRTIANEPETITLPDWLPLPEWRAFLEHRASTKHPMTLKAQEMTIERLEKLREGGDDPAEVLRQSIISDYRGVFPVKDKSKPSTDTKQSSDLPFSPATGNGVEAMRERSARAQELGFAERMRHEESDYFRQAGKEAQEVYSRLLETRINVEKLRYVRRETDTVRVDLTAADVAKMKVAADMEKAG